MYMKNDLTPTEQSVLDTIWEADTPLSALEVAQADPSLNINTIQNCIRSLLKKGYIEVGSIGYSGKVLCRRYQPSNMALSYSLHSFVNRFALLKKRIPDDLISLALVGKEADDEKILQQLEKIYRERNQK